MTAFQTIALAAALAVAALIAWAMRRRRERRAALLPWLAVWLLAALALALPDATTRLAQAVGIGRGADIVLYCAVLAGTFVAFRLSLAQRRLEREVTLLVRELALLRAEPPAAGAAAEDR